MAQEIYLIDNGNELKNKLIQLFEKEKEYKFKKAKTTEIEKMKIIVLHLLLLYLLIKKKNIELKFCKHA